MNTTPEEKTAQATQVAESLWEISNGDENAAHFCGSLHSFAHLIDDLYDKDHTPAPNDVAWVLAGFIEDVASNPFFQKNAPVLLTGIRSALLSWASSEQFKAREDVRDKLAAEVLKSGYQDVFFLVAGLTGGMSHALKMSEKWRGYDFG